MAEKIHSTVLLSLCQKSVQLFQTCEGNTEQVTKKKNNSPPLSNIKGREALATWNVFNEALLLVKRGPSKCIKHPIELKENKLSSTHLVTAIACNKQTGCKNITDRRHVNKTSLLTWRLLNQ